jgi:hypothetical protein
MQTFIVNSLICWEQGCIGLLFHPFQWWGATVSFDIPGNAQIEQVWNIALFVEIQHDSVKIKGACIDFIPPVKVVTVAATKKWNKMEWILKTEGFSRMTVKQQWLTFILALKSKFWMWIHWQFLDLYFSPCYFNWHCVADLKIQILTLLVVWNVCLTTFYV